MVSRSEDSLQPHEQLRVRFICARQQIGPLRQASGLIQTQTAAQNLSPLDKQISQSLSSRSPVPVRPFLELDAVYRQVTTFKETTSVRVRAPLSATLKVRCPHFRLPPPAGVVPSVPAATDRRAANR